VVERFQKLKIHPRESYNTEVERLIPPQTDEGELSKLTLREISLALEDVEAGRTMAEVKKRVGLMTSRTIE
jgi:hypothetical protein